MFKKIKYFFTFLLSDEKYVRFVANEFVKSAIFSNKDNAGVRYAEVMTLVQKRMHLDPEIQKSIKDRIEVIVEEEREKKLEDLSRLEALEQDVDLNVRLDKEIRRKRKKIEKLEKS